MFEDWVSLTVFVCELTVEQVNQVNNVRFRCFEQEKVKRKRQISPEETTVKQQKTQDSLYSLGELMDLTTKMTENIQEIDNLVRKSRELDCLLDNCQETVTEAAKTIANLKKTLSSA